jgi:uncharacterized protein (DUF58 family)
MTRNFKLFLGATIIFYIIGALNDARAMYVLAGAALAVILGAYVLSRAAVTGFAVQVRMPQGRGKAGTKLPFVLQLTNERAAARPSPTISLRVENLTVSAVGRPYRFVLPSVGPRAVVELDVAAACPARGRYRVTEVAVEGVDPVGMFRRPRRFDASGDFLALPRTYATPGIAAWEFLSPGGRRVARGRRRDSGDFGGIREYAPGDDLRYVHWKATAHTGKLAIKEFEQRQDAQVAIWLDLSAGGVVGEGAQASTEIAVSLAASLLQTFVAADYTVQLVGEGLSQSLALPSRGEAYLGRVYVALAEAQATSTAPFSALIMEQMRSAGRAHGIFAVTAAADPGFFDALAFCGTHGISPSVFIVDPGGRRPEADAAIRRCRGMGLGAVLVTEEDQIPAAMREAASYSEQQVMV